MTKYRLITHAIRQFNVIAMGMKKIQAPSNRANWGGSSPPSPPIAILRLLMRFCEHRRFMLPTERPQKPGNATRVSARPLDC